MYSAWFPFKITKTPKFAQKTSHKRHKMKGMRETNYLQLANLDFIHWIFRRKHLKLNGKLELFQGKSQNELVF